MFGFNFLKKIPKWGLFLITTGFLVLNVLLILLYAKYTYKWLMTLIIITTVLFIISMNISVSRIAVYKAKKSIYNTKYYKGVEYSDICKRLKDEGFTFTKKTFGSGFIKIEGKTAYKVLLIDDSNKYFSGDDKSNQTKTKGIEKCTKMIGFELFYDITDDVLKRLPDFSFSGDKILYEGFAYDREKDLIVEMNQVENKAHKDEYDRLMSILGLIEENK